MADMDQAVFNIPPSQAPDFTHPHTAKRPQEDSQAVAGIRNRSGDQPGDFTRGKDAFLSGRFRRLPDGTKRVPVQFLSGNGISHRDTHPQQHMINAVF
jgi:hypothetical protein